MLENLNNIIPIIKSAPKLPGVYIFFGAEKKVLYVGKAIKLSERLKYYIDKNVLYKYPKTLKMVDSAVNIIYFTVDTEVEALVLEANLIKKYKPKYNIDLKDDKNYKLIEVYKDKMGSFKLKSVRKRNNKGVYFGPYPSSTDVNYVLSNIRKIFPYRDCSISKFKYYETVKRPCLYGHIGLCPAPCQGEYQTKINNQNIQKIKKFLDGKSRSVIKDLYVKMSSLSKAQEYEKANEIKKRLSHYEYLTTNYKNEIELLKNVGDIGSEVDKVKELVEILQNYFTDLNTYLKDQKKLAQFRIEYFDISNLGVDIVVGASTCTIGGVIDKRYYRKYKIKKENSAEMVNFQNDYFAIAQIIKRRILNDDKWGTADLFVIDGGKGQLASALKILESLNYTIPVISLAKKEEEVFLRKDSKFNKIRLPKNSDALSILIKGRNEVHRFGLTYNQKVRKERLYV